MAESRTAPSVIGQLFQSSRPISWINTAFPFGAAYVLSTGTLDAGSITTLVVGALFFLIPYNLLMYGINDVFDYESDLRNPRKGGVEGAVLDRSLHRVTLLSATLLPVPFVVYLIAVGTWLSAMVLVFSLFTVVAYSAPGLRFKERPFLDSITSSLHFVTPALVGVTLAGATFTWPLVALLAAFFCWGMASHALGAVQDILSDRQAGIGSIATVLGGAFTVRFAMGCYAVAAVLVLFSEWPGPLAAIIALAYLANATPYRSVSDADAESSNRAWKRFLWLNPVSGFLVTMLLIWWAFLRIS